MEIGAGNIKPAPIDLIFESIVSKVYWFLRRNSRSSDFGV